MNKKRTVLSSAGEKLDKAVNDWFDAMRSRNKTVAGLLHQSFTFKTAETLGIEGFKASDGWLRGFKRRHCINLRCSYGERSSVSDYFEF